MLHLIVFLVIVSVIVRLVTAPFRHGYRRRYYGYNDGYYNPYRYGCRHRHGIVGAWLPILALVALDRIFTRRF
jgi:hypothetical protein